MAKPSVIATRDTLAIILARMYALPASDVDAFTDDNGSSQEATHNKVAAAGLFTGSSDGNGGRRFNGSGVATKGQLATLAQRAKDAGLVPVWITPALPEEPEETPANPADPVDDPAPVDETPVDEAEDAATSVPDEVDDPDVAPPTLDEGAVDDEGAIEGAPEGLEAPTPIASPTVQAGTCAEIGEAPLVTILSLLPLLGAFAGRRRARRS